MSRKKKINIIYLIGTADYTGGPIQLINLLSELDTKQFSAVVISPQGFLSDKIQKYGVKHVEFNFEDKLFGAKKVQKLIEANLTGLDVIHAQGVRAGYYARLANKKLNKPLIYTEHNWTKDYELPQNWRKGIQLRTLKNLSKYTTHTVCVSRSVQNFLITEGITDALNSSVIYNGVRFKDISRREETSPVVLGTIGALHKRKGHVILFEALSQLKKIDEHKVILKIIGAGPQETFLRQHAVSLGINFDIQWLGVKEDLTDFWSSINIYVQPSLDESFGMAVAEAMGYRIPVVATTAGALPEIVDESGLLVEPGNHEQLVKAIQNVISNDTIRNENIEKAYKRAQELFSVKHMVDEYQKLYIKFSVEP